MSDEIFLPAIVSLALSIGFGRLLIPYLGKLKFGQSIRECGPQNHLQKAGTPTMGGLIMLPAIVIAALYYGQHDSNLYLALFLLLAHAAIGFADDYIKIVLRRNLGLTARQKLLAQIFVAVIFTVFALASGFSTVLTVPVLGFSFDAGLLYYLVAFLLLLGTTNAVNLTDGLDGLAAGATIPVCITYAAICLSLQLQSLTVFAIAIAASCLGFLFFNRKPARVFMGDTGSLALGGGVAALALLSKTEFFLVLIGGLYVVEALSVILQVASFKTTGKRIFRMSPLHHHFELGGWSEQRVVTIFWLASLIFALLGLWAVQHTMFY